MIRKRRKDEGLVPTRYLTPWTMFHEMEKVFDELVPPWISELRPQLQQTRVPSMDVRETEDEYLVEAELPGVSKEDIEIQFSEASMEIRAEKEHEEEEEKEGYIRKERGKLSFYRKLTIPENVDIDSIGAKMSNGVLTVTLPKLKGEAAGKRKVEIE